MVDDRGATRQFCDRLFLAERGQIGWKVVRGAASCSIGIEAWPDFRCARRRYPLFWLVAQLDTASSHFAMRKSTDVRSHSGQWCSAWLPLPGPGGTKLDNLVRHFRS